MPGFRSTGIDADNLPIANLGTPATSTDAATMGYVNTAIAAATTALDPKDSVVTVALTPITLSGEQTISAVAAVAGDRVLVAGQGGAGVSHVDNGLYICAVGAWARAADMAVGSSFAGAFIELVEGGTYANSGWYCRGTAGSDVVGTNPQLWTRMPQAHAATHATGGDDAMTPSSIGAVPTSRTLTAGSGLTGGGDLSADRTFAVAYGEVALTATAGNNGRLPDASNAAKVQTTDATQTSLASFATETDRSHRVEWHGCASTSDNADGIAFDVLVYVRNIAGAVAIIGDVLVTRTDQTTPLTWDVTCSISGTNLLLRVAGEIGKTINWCTYGGATRTTST